MLFHWFMESSPELNLLPILLPFASIVFIIAVGVILLNQQFRKNLHRQQLANEELKTLHQQELLRTTIQVQEDERKRIAQDLHDELGPVLSISRMQLLLLEQSKEDTPKQRDKNLRQIRQFTEQALAITRRVSHQLMPVHLASLGLKKSLEALTEQAAQATQMFIHLKADELGELSWPISLGLYRISAELINNTIKHAKANTVKITIVRKNDELIYDYTDNGKGLPPKATVKGLGLKNIEGRVNALKATLDFGNNKQKGFYAHISIPITA